MKSIRGALTAGVLASLFVVFAVCASALYLYVRYALTREFDHSLFGKARAFASLSNRGAEDLEGRLVALSGLPPAVQETVGRELQGAPLSEVEQVTRDGRLFYKIETSRQGMESEFLVSGAGQYLGVVDEFDFAFYEAALPEFQPSPEAEFYQVWDEDEEPVTKSPSLGAANLVLPDGATSAPRPFNLELPDGRRGRAVLLAFRPRGKGGASSGEADGSEVLVLVMARSRAGLDQALRVVGTGLIGAFLLIGVCSTLAVRWFVAQGL
ncbi:MAG: hypothetical protein HYZ00_08735, partial [Candidatus Hydrogenedentes bacterium]|nr:hypothetical protein [Candidatus Hydrogenedentota bacterium]